MRASSTKGSHKGDRRQYGTDETLDEDEDGWELMRRRRRVDKRKDENEVEAKTPLKYSNWIKVESYDQG